jgi:uncharacterized protein YjdB
MKTITACCLLCLCLAACTPQRRLHRLVARHPELITADTLHFRKIYPLPSKTALLPIPAIRIRQELTDGHPITLTDSATSISVNIAENTTGDTLTLSVHIPPDTLQVDEPVPIKTITVTSTSPSIGRHALENIPLLLCAVVFVLVVFGRRK